MDSSGGSVGSYARVAAKSAPTAPAAAAPAAVAVTAPAPAAAAAPVDVEAAKAAPPNAGPQRRRYRAVFKPLVPVEVETLPHAGCVRMLTAAQFLMQFPTLQISVLDHQKRPAFTSECLTCNVLGRAPTHKQECADHDHSLSDDAADHVKALMNLAIDSRLPLEQTCIIVPVTQRRANYFALKLFAPPERWIESLRNMGVLFDVTAETLATLKSEYDYSSVVDHARALLAHCKARTAVRARMGELDFVRAPDASCSSLLLFAAGDAPTPIMLGDRAKFLEFLGARMAAARAECKDLWSVAFFFCDGPNLFGGLKLDEGVFLRLFGCAVEPPPQMKTRDDVDKKQKLRWVREDNVRFDNTLKMTVAYESVRKENSAPKKCSFFSEKGFCKNGAACRFLHEKRK